MRVLFDQGTPAPLRRYLQTHQVTTAFELGWGTLSNGELLDLAEETGFEILVTTDQNLEYQQNLADRRLSIVVLGVTSWPRIKNSVVRVVETIDSLKPGDYVEIPIP